MAAKGDGTFLKFLDSPIRFRDTLQVWKLSETHVLSTLDGRMLYSEVINI